MRRLLLAAALALIAGPSLAAPLYTVGSSSMMPTLAEGEVIFAAPRERIERGQIAVYAQDNVAYLARVIGLPGDSIAMQDGIVILNGSPLTQAPTEQPIADGCPALPPPAKKCGFAREALPEGGSHVVIDSNANGYLDNTREWHLGPDELFVLGDNRDNAADSRAYGPLKASAMLGLVQNTVMSGRPGDSADRLNGFQGQ